MKRLASILAVMTLFAVAAVAAEGDKEGRKKRPRKRPPGQAGKIVAVGENSITIAKRAKKGEEPTKVEVKTDENTTVTIDRKKAKVSDLKVGMFVFITPAEGTAEKIRARTGRRRQPGDKPRRKKPKPGDE